MYDTPIPMPHSSSASIESQIQENVANALQKTGYELLQNVNIVVHGRHVRLTGVLPSYYLKQRAHHAVLQVSGVERLDDDIEVIC